MYLPQAPSIGNFGLKVRGAILKPVVAVVVPTIAIMLQNDTATASTSPWYVTKIADNQYAMPNATYPKASQYIGAFQFDLTTQTRGARLDSTAVWTTTDANIVQITSVSASGQAVINIKAQGVVTLTVVWQGITATLKITVVGPSS